MYNNGTIERYSNSSNLINSKLVGVTFENRQKLISELKKDSFLLLKREYENEFDDNAISAFYEDKKIGYLNEDLAKRIAIDMDAGKKYICKINNITGSELNNYGVNITLYLCDTDVKCNECNNYFLIPCDKSSEYLCPYCRTPYKSSSSKYNYSIEYPEYDTSHYTYDSDDNYIGDDDYRSEYTCLKSSDFYSNEEKKEQYTSKEHFNHYIAKSGVSLVKNKIDLKNPKEFISAYRGLIIYKDMIYKIENIIFGIRNKNNKFDLCRYSIDGKNRKVLFSLNNCADSFVIINDIIYISIHNENSERRLISINIDGYEFKDYSNIFGTSSYFNYIFDNNLIYYNVYLSSIDGTNKITLQTGIGRLQFIKDKELFWLQSCNKYQGIFKSCSDGSEKQVLFIPMKKEDIDWFIIHQESIYFKYYDERKLYRYNTNDEKIELVNKVRFDNLTKYLLKDDMLYYIDTNNKLQGYNLKEQILTKIYKKSVYDFYVYNNYFLVKNIYDVFFLVDLNDTEIRIGKYEK